MFRSSSLLFGFSARLCLALQMRILPFSFFAYNFFIHPLAPAILAREGYFVVV